jgi:hypothetical protein
MGIINDLLMILMETVNRRAPRRVRARRNLPRAQGHSEPAAHPSSFIDYQRIPLHACLPPRRKIQQTVACFMSRLYFDASRDLVP